MLHIALPLHALLSNPVLVARKDKAGITLSAVRASGKDVVRAHFRAGAGRDKAIRLDIAVSVGALTIRADKALEAVGIRCAGGETEAILRAMRIRDASAVDYV